MKKDASELHEIIADLKLIKKAVSKSDSIISFIDFGGALRAVLLAVGLLIAAFSAFLYYLLGLYGSFAAIPQGTRAIFFVLVGLAWAGIAYAKIRNFLHGARKITSDMTFYKLLRELYTPRFVALLLPHILTMVMVIIFLGCSSYELYIIPSLAVLLGLLTISVSSFFFMKEIFLLGLWLMATGLLVLFVAETIHPLAAVGITFAAGFILSSLLMYLGLPAERGSSDVR